MTSIGGKVPVDGCWKKGGMVLFSKLGDGFTGMGGIKQNREG